MVADISYSYFQPDVWEQVASSIPASVVLSPYVKWTSLQRDLDAAKELIAIDRKALIAEYQRLAGHADTLGYIELAAFAQKLEDRKLLGAADDSLTRIMQEFAASASPQLSRDYVPEHAAMHVLLHEVGLTAADLDSR